MSPCTVGVRRQFENCESWRQHRKSASEPLSRRSSPATDSRSPKNPTLQLLQKSSKSASTTPEADLEHFWNCCGAGFWGELLYTVRSRYKRQLIQLNIYKSGLCSASPFISHLPERQMSFPSCTSNMKSARLTHNIDVDAPIKSGNRPPDSRMIDRRNPSVALRARSADSTDTAFSPSAPSAAVARRCRRS